MGSGIWWLRSWHVGRTNDRRDLVFPCSFCPVVENLYHRGHGGCTKVTEKTEALLVLVDLKAILPVGPEEPGYGGD